MSLEPCGLGGEGDVRLDHTFLEAHCGGTKVLFGARKVVLSHREFFERLAFLLAELGDLKVDQILGVLQLSPVKSCLSLCLTCLAQSLETMEYRNIDHHTGIEETTPILLEAILKIRVGH